VPKQIQTGLVGSSLVRRFGIKGAFQPILDEVVVPVTSVDEGSELKPASALFVSVAKPGDNPFLKLTAPTGTAKPLIITIDRIVIRTTAAQDFLVAMSTVSVVGATLATVTKGWLDTEYPGLPQLTVSGGSQLTATLAALSEIAYIGSVTGASGGFIDKDPRLVLRPGDDAVLYGNLANTGWTYACVQWTEEEQENQ